MPSVPILGHPAGEPTDASRPSGDWFWLDLMKPLCLDEIVVWREGWDAPMRWRDLDPQSNVVGLLWRLE